MGTKSRRKPDIQAFNQYIPKEEFRMCRGHGCRNAIATWAADLFCIRCRGFRLKENRR